MKEIKIQVALCGIDLATGRITIKISTNTKDKNGCGVSFYAKVENNDMIIKEKVKLMLNELLKQITLNNE